MENENNLSSENIKQIVISGNNIETLKNYPDNYFDAVVTDPPYGLGKEPNAEEMLRAWIDTGYLEVSGSGFMGKEWDAFVPQPLFWKEIFRVLKYGGHIVSFFGTRTYDWGCMAIRLAGFEIRDCIQWVYGCLSDDTEILTKNGYIPYHKFKDLPNFGQQEILIYDIENDIYKWEKPERWNDYSIHKDTCYRIKSNSTDQIVSRNHRCLVEREGKLVFIQAELLSEMEYMPTLSDDFFELQKTKVLQSSMQRILSGSRMEEMGQNRFRNSQFTTQQNEKRKQRGKKPCVEGWNNLSKKERILFGCEIEICEMPERIYSNGEERWLCGGISVSNGKSDMQTFVKNRVCSSYRPQSNEQRHKQPNAICNEQGTQAIRVGRSYSTTLATITPFEYTGVIFCPTVSTGCFVARRNGKIFITGNSGFPKSHNISKAIDKMPKANNRLFEFAELLKHRRNELHFSLSQADDLICEGSTMYNFLEGRNINGVLKVYPPNKEYYEKIKSIYGIQGWDDIVENNLEIVGEQAGNFGFQINGERWNEKTHIKEITTEQAKQWEGWGSALKPANEPIVLARKPLEKGLSIAENVLKWGTGAINIDGCRVGNEKRTIPVFSDDKKTDETSFNLNSNIQHHREETTQGRFPANFIMTHHPDCKCQFFKYEGEEEINEEWTCVEDCPIKILDEQSGTLNEQGISKSDNKSGWQNNYVGGNGVNAVQRKLYLDKGGASRFFYIAKANKWERNYGLQEFENNKPMYESHRPNYENTKGIETPYAGAGRTGNENRNNHPTVKPIKLMQYLVRMITPPNGIVLDPFAGSGTTGIACKIDGFNFVGLELSEDYTKIANARIESFQEENVFIDETIIYKNRNKEEDENEEEDDINNSTQLSLF